MATQQLASCEYKTGKTLGKGSYASVKEAVKISTGERFAAKVISKKLMQGKEQMILNEIQILKTISQGHRNIVALHDYFETPNNFMDYCTGGELFDSICRQKHFYEQDAVIYVKCIVDAVAYLHSKSIVHRDIKPENILFRTKEADSDLVLTDFGLSGVLSDNEIMKTTCGTPGYMAPEIILKTGYGKPVDMWAIGVMTFFLLSGSMPFAPTEKNNDKQEQDNVINCRYNFSAEIWNGISDSARSFIKGLLLFDQTKRLSAAQALKHPWMTLQKTAYPEKDLLPNVRAGFDARKMFKRAIGAVKAINSLSRSASLLRLQNSSSSVNSAASSRSSMATDSRTGSLASSFSTGSFASTESSFRE